MRLWNKACALFPDLVFNVSNKTTGIIRPHFHRVTEPLPYIDLLSVQWQTLQAVACNSHGVACFCCCRRNCDATRRGTRPLQLAVKRYHFGYDTLTTLLPPFTKTKLMLFMTTLTKRTPTSSLPKKSKKMENFLS